ncbi:DegV family protein with EDD domain [Orenia metallireducens]|uniref:EDD domain protein, DegV family n=1 Tax=Orenia metallireducens TaxID=1413210 RepID=A0A285IHR1_9FIRM|nr:DegV family protein [Orenia metallireducens]PRX17468.1 DegV family protein with EDD domain [Orenia metallireducens]SNY47540.1 EDD domain protein, DegV family [Orenia metallireducens]
MNIKIVVDSGCDFNQELTEKLNTESVPLTIQLDNVEYKDDQNLDLQNLLEMMKNSKKSPKTASPSPHSFVEAYQGEESIFVVTLTSKLSSTYNNALLAKDIFLTEVEDKFIHVFDSCSASIGEALVSLKVNELAEQGLKELEIIDRVDSYIQQMKTFFLLESLDNLIKSGRMNKVKGKLASLLSIKPILGEENGEISLFDKARGSKRAFRKLVDIIGKYGENLEDKILGIAHCNALDKAEKFKAEVIKRYNFKDIIIVQTGGLSSVYANEGGIIISF